MPDATDPRLYHAHVARNREPILVVLKRVLPASGLVVEIASGSGEHAAFFAKALPGVSWQPTDIDATALASSTAHRAAAGASSLLPPLRLDTTAEQWPVERADAIVCNNMIYISPWAVTEGLMRGASRILRAAGFFFFMAPTKSTAATPHQATKSSTFHCGREMRNGAFAISTT